MKRRPVSRRPQIGQLVRHEGRVWTVVGYRRGRVQLAHPLPDRLVTPATLRQYLRHLKEAIARPAHPSSSPHPGQGPGRKEA